MRDILTRINYFYRLNEMFVNMERFKLLRKVVWFAMILLLLQLVIMAVVIYPMSTLMWLSILIVAVLGLYLGRISLALISELDKKELNGRK